MKKLIIGTAVIVLMMLTLVFISDFNKVENAEQFVKAKIEDSASGAVFCIDEAAYAEGYIKFADDEVVEYVQNTLPDDYDVVITLFDDTMRVYDKNGLTGGAIAVTYPYIRTEDNGYSFTVPGPSVQITAVKKTADLYRLPFLEKTEIMRSTAYTWQERKRDESSIFTWFE